jgi:hypothetical protein
LATKLSSSRNPKRKGEDTETKERDTNTQETKRAFCSYKVVRSYKDDY